MNIAKPEPKTCWFCEKPRSALAWSYGRACCPACEGFMRQGVICIGVSEAIEHDTMLDKVYRDGNWCVLSRDEFARRFGHSQNGERFDFIERARWQKAALPRFGKHGASHLSDNSGGPSDGEREDWSKDEEEQASSDAEKETI